MVYLPRFPGFHFIGFISVIFLCLVISSGDQLRAQAPPPPAPAQDTAAKPDSTAAPPQATTAAQNEEVTSRDTPTTFKVRVNLVLVRVVVRDRQGKIISNLKKEDFQLFDNKKLQNISSFAVETPESHTASAMASGADSGSSSSADVANGKAVVLPQRFISVVFDDVHLSMQDASFVRDSATRLFGALAASDRVSLSTTSGQLTQ